MDLIKALLLPQVPVEWEWDEEEFLCNTCMKAGLPADCWYDIRYSRFTISRPRYSMKNDLKVNFVAFYFFNLNSFL